MTEKGITGPLPRQRRQIVIAALPLLVLPWLVLLVIFRFGWPANIVTWGAVLCSGVLPTVSVLMRWQRKRKALLRVSGLYCLILLFPFETDALLDFHSGRTGIDATLVCGGGPKLRYREDGPNTAMLQRLLPRRSESWRYAGLRSTFFGLGSWYDGADVTVGSAMIGEAYLPETLDWLPNEQARVRVLTCLSDPANVARVHQEQLLLTLCELGYPKGQDAASWWRKHEDIFRPEPARRSSRGSSGVCTIVSWPFSAKRPTTTRHAITCSCWTTIVAPA
jgi:hypothetical protein